MRKTILMLSLALANLVNAQFSSGIINLPNSAMTIKLDTNPTTVTLTLTGDSNSMLAIGFGSNGSNGMTAGLDGFIYNSSASRDYTFAGFTAPFADAAQNWTVTSNTVSGNIRTVIATRTLAGGSEDFAFTNTSANVNIFYAKRAGNQAIGYHGASYGYATLNMAGQLSLNETTAEDLKVLLYPNPAKQTLSLKNRDKVKLIDIYEVSGRKVKSAVIERDQIDISDLRPGNYYVEITLKDGDLLYEKLIKE
ncbi:T9SS type A sorting domain-containing protein [Chryseobacterium tongliaoense]|uniref:T9SS type A sorting domain-containing protein n=1 Tax=Chryseobacterium tongliaoense TaxID=3240933 RepID=UPI00351634B3